MGDVVLEICADSLEACRAAALGGARRIELCCALSEAGMTPSHAFLRAAIEVGVPVYVLLRPRGGDFVYSEEEMRLIEADMDHAREMGAAGFVAGVLLADGSVDRERMSRLVDRAGGMELTFHRAFDESNDLERALEDIIATGCRRILTSGGAADVAAGAARLGRLREQAGGRIDLAAGGGLTRENARMVARVSGLRMFHGSLRTHVAGNTFLPPTAEDARTMIGLLQPTSRGAGVYTPF